MKSWTKFLLAFAVTCSVLPLMWSSASAEWEDGFGGSGEWSFFGSDVYVVGAESAPLAVVAFREEGGNTASQVAICSQANPTSGRAGAAILEGIHAANIYCEVSGPLDWVPCISGDAAYPCEISDVLTVFTLKPYATPTGAGQVATNALIAELQGADALFFSFHTREACNIVRGVAITLLRDPATYGEHARALGIELMSDLLATNCH